MGSIDIKVIMENVNNMARKIAETVDWRNYVWKTCAVPMNRFNKNNPTHANVLFTEKQLQEFIYIECEEHGLSDVGYETAFYDHGNNIISEVVQFVFMRSNRKAVRYFESLTNKYIISKCKEMKGDIVTALVPSYEHPNFRTVKKIGDKVTLDKYMEKTKDENRELQIEFTANPIDNPEVEKAAREFWDKYKSLSSHCTVTSYKDDAKEEADDCRVIATWTTDMMKSDEEGAHYVDSNIVYYSISPYPHSRYTMHDMLNFITKVIARDILNDINHYKYISRISSDNCVCVKYSDEVPHSIIESIRNSLDVDMLFKKWVNGEKICSMYEQNMVKTASVSPLPEKEGYIYANTVEEMLDKLRQKEAEKQSVISDSSDSAVCFNIESQHTEITERIEKFVKDIMSTAINDVIRSSQEKLMKSFHNEDNIRKGCQCNFNQDVAESRLRYLNDRLYKPMEDKGMCTDICYTSNEKIVNIFLIVNGPKLEFDADTIQEIFKDTIINEFFKRDMENCSFMTTKMKHNISYYDEWDTGIRTRIYHIIVEGEYFALIWNHLCEKEIYEINRLLSRAFFKYFKKCEDDIK